MSVRDDAELAKLLMAAFRMPSVQTMTSRKTSITNAFVCAIIPTIRPSLDEVAEALAILGMDAANVRCAYCSDAKSEWDHLRPLVMNRRPTGYISEIANLVPACEKCNQSKGNKPWRSWMLSKAKLSPTGRGLTDVVKRISHLEAYERWRAPTIIDFETIVSSEAWAHYWSLCERVNDDLRDCQEVANSILGQAVKTLGEAATAVAKPQISITTEPRPT
jgi:hypothetical protein